MKTITGLLITGALLVPTAPAAAQSHDLQHDIDHIVDASIALAADALDQLAAARAQSSVERDRSRERARQARDRARARQDRETLPEYTDVFSKTVKLGRNGRLELDSVAGNVQITGDDGDEVRITATKKAHAPTEAAARDQLRATDIVVTERTGNVSIQAEATRGRQGLAAVDYVITVPSGTDLLLNTIAGDVTLKNTSGDIRIDSKAGDIRITDTKSRDVDVKTVSGDVQLQQVEAERVTVESTAGDIEYRGRLMKNGHYEFRTTGGDVHIVPDASAFDVEASTFSGDFSSDFALKLQGTTTRNSFGGNGGRGILGLPGGRGTLRGTYNEGGPVLSIRSLSGDISITKK
ncbi:MAG TPA: DUF4097 family beta strand repeat-containing protein [Vicinamibacterales bacterium]|nr:DUF4097 family beta strand repeat-containing protein [Vicinamibacterales bacterium]